MDVLKSLSAFFSSVPTPTKRRQEPSPPATIEDLRHWLTNHETVYGQQILDDTLKGVLKNPEAFERLLPHQKTPEVCNKAVSINGHVIHYLTDEERTPQVCLAAVSRWGPAIKHLTDAQRTPEVCLAAVQQDGRAIYFLTTDQRTPEVCLAAVQRDGYSIKHLTDAQRTPEVCLAAVQQDGYSIQHLTDAQRTLQVCLAAVQQNCHAIEHLSEAQRTPELCLVALQTRPRDWRAGSPIRHLSLQKCVHPMVSSWIIANWAACASSLGNSRAAEVAQAILHAREQADVPQPQERSEDRYSAQRG